MAIATIAPELTPPMHPYGVFWDIRQDGNIQISITDYNFPNTFNYGENVLDAYSANEEGLVQYSLNNTSIEITFPSGSKVWGNYYFRSDSLFIERSSYIDNGFKLIFIKETK